ncbi:hypothetical protein F5Y11DRAFT_363988 [Daldinia sp. FL1419]|nr:hypothetical protein F5Y11DRAFT_363988 [Daldinia sp. FL1419]
MRRLILAAASTIVLAFAFAFDGVLSTPAPILPDPNYSHAAQLQQLPHVKGAQESNIRAGVKYEYGLKTIPGGLVQIPGAQVTAGQLAALPGIETSAVGEVAMSSATMLETSKTSKVSSSFSLKAVAINFLQVFITSSLSSMPTLVESSQSFQIIPVATATSSSTAINIGGLANSSTSAVPPSSTSIQGFHTISAGAATTTASSVLVDVSTSVLVTSASEVITTSRLVVWFNTTATTATAEDTIIRGTGSTVLIPLPTIGTQRSLSSALVSLSGDSSATAVQALPTVATSVQITSSSLAPFPSGIASSTGAAAASGVQTNNTLPPFSLSAGTIPTTDVITMMLVAGATGVLTMLLM